MLVPMTTGWLTPALVISVTLLAGNGLERIGETAHKSRSAVTAPVGVARIDITPDGPVRMYGYAARKTESEGVAGRLHAKALAIGADEGEGPAVLLTVDCGAVPARIRSEVLARLQVDTKIKEERFLLCNSHVHSGPNVKGAGSLPKEHQANLRRYTRQLTGWLEQVVRRALRARKEGLLARAQGKVEFAANRRVLKEGKWAGFGAVPGAPVDHALPLLRVTDAGGKLVAVVVNYACHATTLRADFRKIHGDWVGCAQEYIEADHPGTVALICIGCGADADPYPHGTVELAEKHGRALADEVKRLLQGPMTPVAPELNARLSTLRFLYSKPPDREELQERAKSSWNIREVLKRLERGEDLPAFEYSIATWVFGDDLAMVFLSGEVVVDYARRLKRELDGNRLWVTAYTNGVPCYVVSKRLLREGGYEVRNSISSRVSYGRPGTVEPPIEDRIVDQVRALLPEGFRTPGGGASSAGW